MIEDNDIVTAGILVIGDEILSGRTKDQNIGWIAERLTSVGIDLKEVRVVADDEADIVDAVNALRTRFDYVFTTGGIGPTHDDITADAIAAAFNVGIDHDPRAVAILEEIFPAGRINEARLRMARIPDGADLIANPLSKAPGFRLGNVHVMAGVPKIMQSMLEEVLPTLRTGQKVLSETILANAKEGDVGTPLAEIQRAHPEVSIGSYPFQDEHGYNTNLVVRGRDAEAVVRAKSAIEAMLISLSKMD
ncbi:competence/damage-inducible protein A [Terrihabitans sp. B22-R8]|uniref:competence/damage-inducible protein A n=1 Tax=Terrihabitans sp. B22-R8 TaxID=3425128 RepID=UPI00403D2C61